MARFSFSAIGHLRAFFPNEEWDFDRARVVWTNRSGWYVYFSLKHKAYIRSDTQEALFNEEGGLIFKPKGPSTRFDKIDEDL
jgi:hypothetical protein